MDTSQDHGHTRDAGGIAQIVTNLPIVQEDTATGAVAKAYADYRECFGRSAVPGILKCFATHPPLLEQMISLASNLLFAESYLARSTKEMLATYVSALNDCPYCLDSHASFLRIQGGSNELLSALSNKNLETPSIGVQERQLLSFAHKVTNESYKVTPSDIQQLTYVGWNQLQIAEATHITALFAFFNRVANTFGLPSQHRLDQCPASIALEEKLVSGKTAQKRTHLEEI